MTLAKFSALGLGIVGAITIGIVLLTNKPSSTNQPIEHSSNQPAGASLDYSGKGLTQFPKEILDRTDVVSLDLSNNQLSGALPAEIRHMTGLKVLDVSNNRMTGIPAEIGQLKNLRALNYNNNRLSGLPMELGNLTQLQILDLSGNQNLSQRDLGLIRAKLPNTTIKL